MKGRSRHYRTILLAALLAGCGAAGAPEEAVRAWLEAAEAAAEARDRDALVDMISERYVDWQGNDRRALDQRLRIYFLRNRNIVIASRVDELTVSGGTAAKVVLTAGLVGTGESSPGFSADALRFELELEEDGGQWRLIGARWSEL